MRRTPAETASLAVRTRFWSSFPASTKAGRIPGRPGSDCARLLQSARALHRIWRPLAARPRSRVRRWVCHTAATARNHPPRLLAAGFGVQIGLYKYVRIVLKKKKDSLLGGVSASGGVSTLSMLACCAHHIADVLPFLGLSAAAVFLAQFYIPFILLGIFTNLAGIAFISSDDG